MIFYLFRNLLFTYLAKGERNVEYCGKCYLIISVQIKLSCFETSLKTYQIFGNASQDPHLLLNYSNVVSSFKQKNGSENSY